MRQLDAVGNAHHVVVEHHTAHPGQLHATGLQRIPPSHLEAFGPLDKRPADGLRPGVVKAAIEPVAVRAEHPGQLSRAPLRSIEAPGDEVAGKTLQINPFDGVAVAIDFAVYHGVVGRPSGHRPESQRHQQLPPQAFRPDVPGTLGARRPEREVAVKILQVAKAMVLGQFAQRKRSRPCGGRSGWRWRCRRRWFDRRRRPLLGHGAHSEDVQCQQQDRCSEEPRPWHGSLHSVGRPTDFPRFPIMRFEVKADQVGRVTSSP